MQQQRSRPSKRVIEEGNNRLRQMSACEGIKIDFTETGIWVSHANTPRSDLNLRQFMEELEQGGIVVEARSFYCG